MARRRDQRAAGQAGPPYDQSFATVPVGQHRRVEPGGENGGRVLRLLALIAVAGGVIALTAGACVLSYTSVHDLALHAGVSHSLARIYPGLADAMLVIAGCAVLALRGAGLISKIYAWLCFVVLLAAIAAGSALRPAHIHVNKHWAEVTAAIFPWALVLVAFGLLLALLRHARRRRRVTEATATAAAAAARPVDAPLPPTAPPPAQPTAPPPAAVAPPLVAPPLVTPPPPAAIPPAPPEPPRPAQSWPAEPVTPGAGPSPDAAAGPASPAAFDPGGWRLTTVEPDPASAEHEPEPADSGFDPITHEATTRRPDADSIPAAASGSAASGSIAPDHPTPTSQTVPRDRPAPLLAADQPSWRPEQPATTDPGSGTGWPTDTRPSSTEPPTAPWLTPVSSDSPRPDAQLPPSGPPSLFEPQPPPEPQPPSMFEPQPPPEPPSPSMFEPRPPTEPPSPSEPQPPFEPQPPAWIPRPLSTDRPDQRAASEGEQPTSPWLTPIPPDQPPAPADASPWLSHEPDTNPSHTQPAATAPADDPATPSWPASLSDPVSPSPESTTPTWFPRLTPEQPTGPPQTSPADQPAQPDQPDQPDQPSESADQQAVTSDAPATDVTPDSDQAPQSTEAPTSPWPVPMSSAQQQLPQGQPPGSDSRPRPVVRPAEMQLRARTHRPAHAAPQSDDSSPADHGVPDPGQSPADETQPIRSDTIPSGRTPAHARPEEETPATSPDDPSSPGNTGDPIPPGDFQAAPTITDQPDLATATPPSSDISPETVDPECVGPASGKAGRKVRSRRAPKTEASQSEPPKLDRPHSSPTPPDS